MLKTENTVSNNFKRQLIIFGANYYSSIESILRIAFLLLLLLFFFFFPHSSPTLMLVFAKRSPRPPEKSTKEDNPIRRRRRSGSLWFTLPSINPFHSSRTLTPFLVHFVLFLFTGYNGKVGFVWFGFVGFID